MNEKQLGEIWESFFIEGQKVGFLRREIGRSESPNILVSTVDIAFGEVRHHHRFYFENKAGYPSRAYLFDTNEGAAVHARFHGRELSCQVDEHLTIEEVPADARPSYGNYPLIVSIPFEENDITSFTQIDDSACTVLGRGELISRGWDEVRIGGERHRLWRVEEFLNGRAGNQYWLDQARCLRASNWQGAKSYWEPSREAALAGLSAELVSFAQSLGDESALDWTAEVENWLNEER